MTPEIMYEKLKLILQYIEDEASKPLENYNYETRLWSKGYRKAMITIESRIWNILNSDDL